MTTPLVKIDKDRFKSQLTTFLSGIGLFSAFVLFSSLTSYLFSFIMPYLSILLQGSMGDMFNGAFIVIVLIFFWIFSFFGTLEFLDEFGITVKGPVCLLFIIPAIPLFSFFYLCFMFIHMGKSISNRVLFSILTVLGCLVLLATIVLLLISS
jgi:hypothetical protein